jgi:hypothetical protein
MKRMERVKTKHVSTFSFAGVLLLTELAARLLAPSLPVEPGKWPRIEIAQKLDQMRSYVNEGKEIEVLFTGSSMMAGGVDPVAFTEASGRSGYNAAFAGPSMRTVTPWTLEIAEPLLNPDVVVVGIQSREFNDSGVKHQIMSEKFLTSPGYKETTSAVSSALVGPLEEVSYLLRYRRAFREPSLLFRSIGEESLAAARVRHVIGTRGRRNDEPGTYRAPERFLQDLYDKTLKDYEVGGPEYEALLDLHRGLAQRNIELILLNMPVTDDYWGAHADPEGDRQSYLDLIDDFVRETGATLIDAERSFPDNGSFRDPMHLDVEGRELLAEGLAEGWKGIVTKGGSYTLRCAYTCKLHRTHTASKYLEDGWARAARGAS